MAKIIKIQGAYKLPEAISHSDNSERFDYIYRSGLWLDGSEGESRSGGGSAKKATTLYKDQLNQYLDLIDKSNDGNKLNFFDAPCGDLNWVKDF